VKSVTPLPAATVVLMRDDPAGDATPQVLLVERHRDSSVGPGAFVFPGGVLEPGDSHPRALRLSPRLTPAQAALRLGEDVPPETALGLFNAAIRETFEETRVLLARSASGAPVAADALAEESLQRAREALHGRKLDFYEWVAGLGLALATEDLIYYAHWITPEGIRERFSARFFLVAVPGEVRVETDRREVTGHSWLAPAEALARYEGGALRLMPPTVRNLELLAQFPSTGEALVHLKRRAAPTIRPRLILNADGTRTLVYPWDPAYEQP
jgi:8-oxo-dGTP pyrophosphatase MutT (NUDIX family)